MIALVKVLCVVMIALAIGIAGLTIYTVETFHSQNVQNCQRVNRVSGVLADLVLSVSPEVRGKTAKIFQRELKQLKPEVCK